LPPQASGQCQPVLRRSIPFCHPRRGHARLMGLQPQRVDPGQRGGIDPCPFCPIAPRWHPCAQLRLGLQGKAHRPLIHRDGALLRQPVDPRARKQQSAAVTRQVDHRTALPRRQQQNPRRFRLKTLQRHVRAQRIGRAGAIEMRVHRHRIDHVATHHRQNPRPMPPQRPIGGGKGHGAPGIDHAAIGIIGRDVILRRHDPLAGRHLRGPTVGGKIFGMDQAVPIGPHPPCIIDRQDMPKRAFRPGLRPDHIGPAAQDRHHCHICPLPVIDRQSAGCRKARADQRHGDRFLRPSVGFLHVFRHRLPLSPRNTLA
jgi:hypothetical protein